MLETTERLLSTLSALQGTAAMAGPELAARLGVTVRTVRRDVERLRQLGYAVESTRGPAGGYRLGRGGSAPPPLMLDDEEAVALAFCVRASAAESVSGVAASAASALGKLDQTLPAQARARVDALVRATVRLPSADDEIDRQVLLVVTGACRDGQALEITYRSARGTESALGLEPYRVVNAGRRWYLVARDRRRGEWRTYRLDRIASARTTGHGVDVSDAPDAAAFVAAAVTTAPYRYRARVEVDLPLDELARRVPATVGVLEAVDDRTTLLSVGGNDIDWLALHLGALDAPFRVLEPPELERRVIAIGRRMVAGGGLGAPQAIESSVNAGTS